jgi:predicted phage terminase large subunit-like protein
VTAIPDPNTTLKLSTADLLKYSALDTSFFAKVFFPKTVRQKAALFHSEMDRLLDDPRNRYLNLIGPRGFAKTSKLRLFTAKRIALNLSHTILYIGASEAHAQRSLEWIRSAIDRNTMFSGTFALSPGRKWNESELEVVHGLSPGNPIWLLGVGVTGNLRGINFDDYRPDLIIFDDALTDENTGTKEQREKLNDIFFTSVKESLAPAVESPNAKLVALNTPHDREDLTEVAAKDPTFTTRRWSCWTPETEDLPLEKQVSAWEEMKPTPVLRAEKQAAIATNRYAGWARENECKLVLSESLAFRPDWLRSWDKTPEPMFCVLAIDPVPPPSDRELAEGLRHKDFEAHAVIGRRKGEYFILDYSLNRGHEPNWSVSTAIELARRYRVQRIVVESVAYQRVLKWHLEQEMRRRGQYWAVEAYKDHRKKYVRITSAISGIASQGRLLCSPVASDLRSQFSMYPSVDHDDLLDAVAIGLSSISMPFLEGVADDDYLDESAYPDLKSAGGRAP